MNKWEYKRMRVWIIERNIRGKETKKRELNKERKGVSEEMIAVKKKRKKLKKKEGQKEGKQRNSESVIKKMQIDKWWEGNNFGM